jgi:hypothetical protein
MNVSQRIAALGAPSILPTVQRTSDRATKIRTAVAKLYDASAVPVTITVGECPSIVAQAMTSLRAAGYSDADAKTEMSKALVWGGNANLFRTWYMAARDDLNMTFSMAATMSPFFDALADVYCMFTFDTAVYVAWAPQSISYANGDSIARFGDNDPQLNVPGNINPVIAAQAPVAVAPDVSVVSASASSSTASSASVGASASAIAAASASAIATASASITAAAFAGSAVVSTVTSIAGTATDVETVTQTTAANGAVSTTVSSTAPLAAGETIQQRIARMLAAAQATKAAI